MPIAEYRDRGFIVINKKESIHHFSNYLYFIDQGMADEPINLFSNFELWLERIVHVQGNPYWDWNIYTAENTYRLR